MDFQIRLFTWPDQGNHLVIIGRGPIVRSSFSRVFSEIETSTRSLAECKVLLDLSKSSCEVDGPGIEEFAADLFIGGWSRRAQIAIVSAVETSGCQHLYALRCSLAARGVAIEIFPDSKSAIDWLAA